MSIEKKIDTIVKKISTEVPGGNLFFDKIDSEIKKPQNIDIILNLFEKIYSDFGFNYNLVVSGGFSDILIDLIKKRKVICKGSILQVSGGLTSHFTDMDKIKKVKEIIIQKQIGDIENKDFIFVDDSFYSGTTLFSINVFLKQFNSKVIKTYVVYDGNDKKSEDRISLYNYYDWNRGSKRTYDELMKELSKYDVPRDVFERMIIKGEIISIIELRKKVNEYLISSGQKGIDIYTRVRENKVLRYTDYITEKLESVYFGYGWEEFDPKKEGIVAKKIWRHKLKDGFNCLVRLTDSSHIIYLEEPDETLNFMDYLKDPFMFNKGVKNDTEFAIDICENQLDYYEKLKIFPDEDYIKSILYPFTDEDIYLQSDIKYGYEYRLNDESSYDLTQYLKLSRFSNINNFICAFILNTNTSKTKKPKKVIDDIVSEFKSNLKMDYGDEFKVEHLLDDRGLVIIIKLK